jgi:hypothetical protein
MSNAALVFFLQILTLAGSVLLVGKLFATGIYRRYRMFFLLFIFSIFNEIWPMLIDVKSDRYAYFWRSTAPVAWVLYILAVLELYRLVLEKHHGLYSLGRWIMYAAIVIAVFISVLTLLPHFTPDTPQSTRTLGYFFAAQRGIESSLAIFILLILLFLSRYPVKLSRNVLVHTALYSIYFLSGTLYVLLRLVFGLKISAEADLLLAAVNTICVFAWLFLLTRKGEEVETNLPLFGPEYERRALQQLEALNTTLLRVSRN